VIGAGKKQALQLQLQLWNPRAKAYEPASAFESASAVSEVWDRLRRTGRESRRPWRLAAVKRPLTVPPLRRKPLAGYMGRDALTVQVDYLKWAQAKRLKAIHAYPCTCNFEMVQQGYRKPKPGPDIFLGTVIELSIDEQFAVVETIDSAVDLYVGDDGRIYS
jgi:hypothetical protein